jgi:hypothetical protein
MGPLGALVLKTAATLGGVGLVVYVLYRLVLAARKMGRAGTGGEIVGVFTMLLGPVIAPPPPHEVAAESQELKRNEDDGDPP